MTGKDHPSSVAAPAKLAFHEAWRTQTGPLKLAAATGTRQGGVVVGADGALTWIDHRGQALWRAEMGGVFRSVSASETQEVLAVLDGGSAMLLDATGQVQWKKRVFPAMSGIISGSGQHFAFLTRDPTVILADRASRPRWTYRNLLKLPAALAITHDGELVAFACQDERGEGLAIVARSGQPAASFLGLDPVIDVAITADGEHVFAIDRAGGVFGFHVPTSAGVWRARVPFEAAGLSHAAETRQTLVYSRQGHLCLLDDHGFPLWEDDVGGTLLTARLSQDGQTIWLATAEGAVVGLQSGAARDLTRAGFAEVVAPPAQPDSCAFQRRWLVELPRAAAGDRPRARLWTGGDQVEYALLWDGQAQLTCLNDLGEEIWTTRLTGGPVRDLAVDAAADLAIVLTAQGVLGFHLDGSEAFRSLGAFAEVHLFGNGAFLLVDDAGRVSYLANPRHPAHPLPISEPIRRLVGTPAQAALQGQAGIHLVDAEGVVCATVPTSGAGSHLGLLPGAAGWALGGEGGAVTFHAWTGEVIYRHAGGGGAPVALAFHPGEDVVFVAWDKTAELLVIQNRLKSRIRVPLPGTVALLALHAEGVVGATTLDELLLIDVLGILRARYPYPDRVLEVLPSASRADFHLLAEGGFGRFAVRKQGAGPAGAPASGEGVET